MNVKKQIFKIALLVAWIVLGSGVLVLLVAARNIKNSKTCKGIVVEISGVKEFLFLDKKDILQIINTGSEGAAEGKAVAHFNLGKLETALKRNVWVKDANLFFDKKDILQIINTGSEGAAEGKAVAHFNLGKLETALKRNVWVKDANLFFDNNLWLH